MELTPFDNKISTPFLQMAKLIIPYLPPHSQRFFAIYIKFMEFQNTLSSFQTFRNLSYSPEDILNELRPYLPSDVSESIDNIINMMSMMEMFQNMSGNAESNPMEMMKGMLSPEQQSMFEMYNTMFSNEQGGDSNA